MLSTHDTYLELVKGIRKQVHGLLKDMERHGYHSQVEQLTDMEDSLSYIIAELEQMGDE